MRKLTITQGRIWIYCTIDRPHTINTYIRIRWKSLVRLQNCLDGMINSGCMSIETDFINGCTYYTERSVNERHQ